MTIKATTVRRFLGVTGTRYVSGRLEIQWKDGGQWLNIGIFDYDELEWLMMVSIMTLGARQANITFIHEDLCPANL